MGALDKRLFGVSGGDGRTFRGHFCAGSERITKEFSRLEGDALPPSGSRRTRAPVAGTDTSTPVQTLDIDIPNPHQATLPMARKALFAQSHQPSSAVRNAPLAAARNIADAGNVDHQLDRQAHLIRIIAACTYDHNPKRREAPLKPVVTLARRGRGLSTRAGEDRPPHPHTSVPITSWQWS